MSRKEVPRAGLLKSGPGREDQQCARRPSVAHERPTVSTMYGAVRRPGPSTKPGQIMVEFPASAK
jgi:hypothetical protein